MLQKIDLKKTEFWIATTIYAFLMIVLLAHVSDSTTERVWTPYRGMFEQYRLHYSYSKFYFFPQVARLTGYYLCFLLWNFMIAPAFLEKRKIVIHAIEALVLFILLWLLLSVTDTWLRNYLFYVKEPERVYNMLFKADLLKAVWVMLILVLYTVSKKIIADVLTVTARIMPKYQRVVHDIIIAAVVCALIVFCMVLLDVSKDFVMLFVSIAITSIVIYGVSFYRVIEEVLRRGKGFFIYALIASVMVLILTIPLSVLTSLRPWRSHDVVIIEALNLMFQAFVFIPFCWVFFKSRLANSQELISLRSALGRSTAGLDFLRSQINPHFLFNALNTLYGTALDENASRTAEGVQRLGDMMRFMLQENVQDKILLARELEYLSNYIALQTLRIKSSPDITISTQIDEVTEGQIAPMLLIPFVENAFKHGISLRRPSHISITFKMKGNTLYFDVNNSLHEKYDDDMERSNNGIGLENVRQRLQLLYPDRHELIIHKSATEFFIHLTLQLN